MKNKYRQYKASLLMGLLTLYTLSSCVNTRQASNFSFKKTIVGALIYANGNGTPASAAVGSPNSITRSNPNSGIVTSTKDKCFNECLSTCMVNPSLIDDSDALLKKALLNKNFLDNHTPESTALQGEESWLNDKYVHNTSKESPTPVNYKPLVHYKGIFNYEEVFNHTPLNTTLFSSIHKTYPISTFEKATYILMETGIPLNKQTFEYLCNQGLDVNVKDSTGRTLLMWIVKNFWGLEAKDLRMVIRAFLDTALEKGIKVDFDAINAAGLNVFENETVLNEPRIKKLLNSYRKKFNSTKKPKN
ncbi:MULTISPECIES: hypothetical protein [Candidatus Cardinium]|uniref:hypothetical protein n=1 Tax=Candidatus Cardinium TaxID=273135 RepID=UPI001FA993FB|nr:MULTISPECIES: hypothetical protein [Cardinium]